MNCLSALICANACSRCTISELPPASSSTCALRMQLFCGTRIGRRWRAVLVIQACCSNILALGRCRWSTVSIRSSISRAWTVVLMVASLNLSPPACCHHPCMVLLVATSTLAAHERYLEGERFISSVLISAKEPHHLLYPAELALPGAHQKAAGRTAKHETGCPSSKCRPCNCTYTA